MNSRKGDRIQAKVEQITSEFFAKSLQIILEARIPSICTQKHFDPSSKALPLTLEPRKRDQWFNLVLGNSDIPWSSIDIYRTRPHGLMVVDILLSQRSGDYSNTFETYPTNPATGSLLDSLSTGGAWPTLNAEGGQILLERWFLEFKFRTGLDTSEGKSDATVMDFAGSTLEPNLFSEKPKRSDTSRNKIAIGVGRGSCVPHLPFNAMEVPVVYKKTILMLRSVYSMARLLPAYRLFRLSCSSPRSCSFALSYRLSASPMSEVDQTKVTSFYFTPIDTYWGQMIIKVVYNAATSLIASEASTSSSPHIIADYVRCPTIECTNSDAALLGSVPIDGLLGRKIHVGSSISSLPNITSGSLFGFHPWWEGGLHNPHSDLLPPSPTPSHVGSFLSCSNLDESVTSFSSHISDGYVDGKTPQGYWNQTVSAPIPIGQNQHIQGSSFCISSGGLPLPCDIDNLQSGPSSQISPRNSERTGDSRPPHYHRKSSPSPIVQYPLPQASPFPASGVSPLSRSNCNIPRLNAHGQKSLVNKPGYYRWKDIMVPIRLVKHTPDQISCLYPTGKSSRLDMGMMHIGSAPVNVWTGFSNSSQAAHGSRSANCQFTNLDDNSEEASKSTSRPLYIRKPFLISGSLEKKGQEGEKSEHTEDDAFTFPFAIDEDGHKNRRVTGINDSRAPAKKSEFTYHRSRGAAAGELILMLKAAAPLSQQNNNATDRADVRLSETSGDAVSTRSRDTIPGKAAINVRTASDALDELKDYKEMRDFLQRQSGRN